MARASSRLAKGPIWTWRRLSFGSLRITTEYPRFFNADTRIAASSWREMAAICTMVEPVAFAETVAGAEAAAAVGAGRTAVNAGAGAGEAFVEGKAVTPGAEGGAVIPARGFVTAWSGAPAGFRAGPPGVAT